MTRKRKTYDPDFKRQAVVLADSTERTDRAIELELGLYQGAIRHWRVELQADQDHAFPGTGRLKPDEEEFRRLRRELEIVRQERDILKKAVAIFSHIPRTGTSS
jgi:transposase